MPVKFDDNFVFEQLDILGYPNYAANCKHNNNVKKIDIVFKPRECERIIWKYSLFFSFSRIWIKLGKTTYVNITNAQYNGVISYPNAVLLCT